MSQETLAEMIGTTRSHVSFFMNRKQQAPVREPESHSSNSSTRYFRL
jgi:hypothetical protein